MKIKLDNEMVFFVNRSGEREESTSGASGSLWQFPAVLLLADCSTAAAAQQCKQVSIRVVESLMNETV